MGGAGHHDVHFLDACFLCRKPLASNRDIFMYRGDTAFCSDECRSAQMAADEAAERNKAMASAVTHGALPAREAEAEGPRERERGKPNRPDERARIEAAGGQVVFINGYRVRGILAMSRAIGDRLLRREGVIAEPEITITERTVEDQCLILASDGLWDVMDNFIACYVARQCLEDGNPPPAAAAGGGGGGAPPAAGGVVGPQEDPRCVGAASLLGRLALGRETEDNISVIVVDLKHRQ